MTGCENKPDYSFNWLARKKRDFFEGGGEDLTLVSASNRQRGRRFASFIEGSHNSQLLGIAFDGRVIAKETQHFLGCIRPSRIGIGTGGTAARPSVASSVDAPLLQDCLPVRIGMDRAGIGMAARHLPATHFRLPVRGSHGTGDDMIGVSGMHYGVTIAVKNDGRDKRSRSSGTAEVSSDAGRVWRTALPHRGECRDKIVGSPTGKT